MSEDKLFTLIKSLTPREKTYVKRFFSLNGDEKKIYFQVFDFLYKKKSYHEDELKKKFQGIKNIPMLKRYIHRKILLALAIYRSGDEKFNGLFRQLFIRVLLDKRLYHQVEKEMVQLEKASLKKSPNQFCSIQDVNAFILSTRNSQVVPEDYQELFDKAAYTWEESKKNYQAKALSFLMFQFDIEQIDNEEVPFTIFGEKASDLLKAEVNQDNIEGQISFHIAKGYYHFKKEMFEQSFDDLQQASLLMLQHHKKALPTGYGAVSHTFLNICAILGRGEVFIDYWNSLCENIKRMKGPQWMKEYILGDSMLFFTNKTGQFSYGEQVLETYFSNPNGIYQKQKLEPIQMVYKCIILSRVVFNYFYSGQLKKVIGIANEFLYDSGYKKMRNFHLQMKLVFLITHFELGNLFLVESEVRSMRRLLEKEDVQDEYLSVVLSAIHYQCINPDQSEEIWRNAQEEMEQFLSAEPKAINKGEDFDFLIYIKSKANKLPYEVILNQEKENLFGLFEPTIRLYQVE